jgi:membrane protease YdiL (CAAX protease family)
MNRQKISMDIPIICVMLYTFYFYVVNRYFVENNMLISVNNITINNVGVKIIYDFCIMLLFPLVLIVIYRKKLIEFNLRFQNTYLQYILIAIMVLLFILHKDFTIGGLYKFFFYLVVVAFGEEFIFRGYVYNKLKSKKILAIIVSGLFFGIMHAILPGVIAGKSISQIGINMLNEIGGGIVIGYFFIYLQEKSKSLIIPVFVHAILDYTIGYIGIITAAGTGIYLLIQDRKKMHTRP